MEEQWFAWNFQNFLRDVYLFESSILHNQNLSSNRNLRVVKVTLFARVIKIFLGDVDLFDLIQFFTIKI